VCRLTLSELLHQVGTKFCYRMLSGFLSSVVAFFTAAAQTELDMLPHCKTKLRQSTRAVMYSLTVIEIRSEIIAFS